MAQNVSPKVTIIGGGMITKIQILPTLYYLQSEGLIGEIGICALNTPPLIDLQQDAACAAAFPGSSFTPYPDPATTGADEMFPDLYKEVLAAAPAGSIAVIAVPDHFHFAVLKEALANGLHILIVKPLVLTHAEAEEIEKIACEKGLVIGIEYHKRFDDRNIIARDSYRAGRMGEFRLAQAHLHEKWYYRDSNFQNWCTCENSDMFTYIGCHYVDLIAFITGLKPTSVSVYGIKDKYPNGKEGYLWTDARVIWENGAVLSVANALGYPNAGPGGNSQGMVMWAQGPEDGTLLSHQDQYRGVKHSYVEAGTDPGDTVYAEPNPDYYQLLNLGGDVKVPVGYGHRSVSYIINACRKATAIEDLVQRQELLKRFDDEGIMATPANSSYNELVVEAGRKSVLSGGREVAIDYKTNTVDFKN